MFYKFIAILKKNVKKIKKHLVKKVELKTYFIAEDYVVFDFDLVNYFLVNKSIRATLEIDDFTYNLENLKLVRKKELKIKVPIAYLSNIQSRATMKLFINKKPVWITYPLIYEEYNESLLVGNGVLVTTVNKNISLQSKFQDLFSEKEPIDAVISSKGYNSMVISLNQDFPLLNSENIEIHAFNNKRFNILNAFYDAPNHKITFDDFSSMRTGLWRLFIKVNNKFLPLNLIDETPDLFYSYLHEINLVKKSGVYYLELRPHSMTIDTVDIRKTDSQSFELKFKGEFSDNDDFLLLFKDSKTDTSENYTLYKRNNTLLATIPFHDLCETHFTKSFFIIKQSKNQENKICKFDLNKKALDNGKRFKITHDSQHKKLKFYIRKDDSLGLTISRPTIRKMITSIDDFQLDGFFTSIDEFPNCDAYFLLEERESLNSIKIPIKSHFTIDLLNTDLINLKTKDKTVIDFFITLENQDKQIVRKEKIRFKHAEYKKDNYYGYKIVNDDKNNQHHFLITATPFHNLKLESFKIPHDIQIPENILEKNHDIWLIGERYNTAQDNGFVFFKWIQNNTDIDIYYVIEDNNPDFERIKDHPNVLTFGSEEHFEIAFKAGVLLGTHDLENILPFKPARGFFGYENTYKIFLQHGVLGRKNVEYHKKFYNDPFDLFIVSSKAEKEIIVMNEMGYDEDEVVVTGLARFDNLIQKEEPKDILLMPTWRDWINTDQQFLASEYYLAYSNLIKNEKLINLLNEFNVNLNFYPHYRAQDFFQRDVEHLNERIKFIPFGSDSVQNLLINHALLITDYSSVSFDFTLLNKPVIFYHFDVRRFFRRGILRPVEDTFIGESASKEDEIVTLIEDRIKNDFSNYDHDISGIIEYQDQSNCLRTYQEIQLLLKRK